MDLAPRPEALVPQAGQHGGRCDAVRGCAGRERKGPGPLDRPVSRGAGAMGVVLVLAASCCPPPASTTGSAPPALLSQPIATPRDIPGPVGEVYRMILNFYAEPDWSGGSVRGEGYRLTWFDPFASTASAVVRIENLDGTWHVTTKRLGPDGSPVVHEVTVGEDAWTPLWGAVHGSYFWSMQTMDQKVHGGSAPTYWALEGLRREEFHSQGTDLYHLVFRDTPYDGSFREACEILVSMSGDPEIERLVR